MRSTLELPILGGLLLSFPLLIVVGMANFILSSPVNSIDKIAMSIVFSFFWASVLFTGLLYLKGSNNPKMLVSLNMGIIWILSIHLGDKISILNTNNNSSNSRVHASGEKSSSGALLQKTEHFQFDSTCFISHLFFRHCFSIQVNIRWLFSDTYPKLLSLGQNSNPVLGFLRYRLDVS